MPATPNLPPVTVSVREDDRNDAHVRLSVFVGRNEGARGHCGQLVLRTDEWDELRAVIEDREAAADEWSVYNQPGAPTWYPLFTVQPVAVLEPAVVESMSRLEDAFREGREDGL